VIAISNNPSKILIVELSKYKKEHFVRNLEETVYVVSSAVT